MKCPRCGTENVDYAVFCVKCSSKLVRPAPLPGTGAAGGSTKQAAPVRSASAAPTVPASTVSAAPAIVYYAGFWKRFLATMIDVLLINILLAVILVISRGGSGLSFPPTAHMLISLMATNVLFWVVFWLYNTIMESSSKQATLGKMLLGIRVTDLDGNRLSFGKENARYWGKLLSALTLYIGFIMAGFTQKKQGLHDILAGTLVVNKQEQPTSMVTVALGIAVVIAAISIFGRLATKVIPKNPQNSPAQDISHLTSTLQTMTMTMGMVEIKAALEHYARNNGGAFPSTLSDQNFVSILPHGQMPPSPFKAGTFLSVAEEKAVDDPVDYASRNSGCNGTATEGEINYYYSPSDNPTVWAINGCDSNGVIKARGSDVNLVLHK